MMDQILSIFPRGFFGNNRTPAVVKVDERPIPMEVNLEEEEISRKRTRDCESPGDVCDTSGSKTPRLISRRGSDIAVPSFLEEDDDDDVRPVKRFRGLNGILLSSPHVDGEKPEVKPEKKLSLTSIPEDVIAHCLSFLNSAENRRNIQCTSKQFRDLSNTNAMRIGVRVGGDPSTGLHGILLEDDTPDTAEDKLLPFAVAGNLEAIYMLGIIQSYCQRDAKNGINMLEMASAQGYARASYALGLVLRDSRFDDALKYMRMAADAGYLPALHELLPAREMKEKYGEPTADELRCHLDHLCLNRLLSRHYIRSPDLRNLSTSHCWNPLCGRWAFKASAPAHGMAAHAHLHRHHVSPQANERANAAGDQTNASTGRGAVSQDSHNHSEMRVSRMKMCSRCSRAKYCSKLCQVYDWRSGRHKMECQFL